MKKIEKIMLNAIAKTTKNFVEHEKNNAPICVVIFHQPKRPEKAGESKCK